MISHLALNRAQKISQPRSKLGEDGGIMLTVASRVDPFLIICKFAYQASDSPKLKGVRRGTLVDTVGIASGTWSIEGLAASTYWGRLIT